jgi:hypothetical protein
MTVGAGLDENGNPNALEIQFGAVEYFDYNVDQIGSPMDVAQPFFHKRKSFEHEREFRGFDFPVRQSQIDDPAVY